MAKATIKAFARLDLVKVLLGKIGVKITLIDLVNLPVEDLMDEFRNRDDLIQLLQDEVKDLNAEIELIKKSKKSETTDEKFL
jgi:lipid A disaccharide synthetase